MPVYLHDPSEDLDYTIDYSEELDAVGSPSDTIAASSFSIEGHGGSPAPSLDAQVDETDRTTVTVSNLELGEIYRLKNVTTTTQGRVLTRAVTIRCEHR